MASLFGEKFYSLSGEFSLYGHRPVVVHVDPIPNQLGCVYTPEHRCSTPAREVTGAIGTDNEIRFPY